MDYHMYLDHNLYDITLLINTLNALDNLVFKINFLITYLSPTEINQKIFSQTFLTLFEEFL